MLIANAFTNFAIFSQQIINLPEFPIIAQPELTAKALNDEAGSQLMVGVSNPHTSRPAEPDASNETLPGANALSPPFFFFLLLFRF